MKTYGLVLGFIFVCWSGLFAQDLQIDEKILYDVYYEATPYEIYYLRNVKIVGIHSYGSFEFLAIQSMGFKDQLGYIDFSKVRSILPTAVMQPTRLSVGSDSIS